MSDARAADAKMPTLYIPHGGGPCFYMDWTMGPKDTWDALATWLRELNASLPATPRALLVVSAHWEAEVPTVTTASRPPLLFDYYGFPPHTYELTWPAPGSPDLAARVTALLSAASIPSAADEARGLDHGVFVPLKLTYPEARVPTVQLSLRADLDPAAHLAIGRALAPLRDEGVLIVGSGMSYHNMRGLMGGTGGADSAAFDAWLSGVVAGDAETRDAELARWTAAPSARQSHPREEHLIPLMVAAGAAGEDRGATSFRGVAMGATLSAVRFG
jgi:aromatic ring-opening dioxygenase catalytic subunit (LigB family)